MYGKVMFFSSGSYHWVPLMFFMLMGYFCYYGELGRDLYSFARNWIGHFRGGLAQGSVCACAAFGAVVGDHLSGSIAMNAIALPEMRANNYDDKLAVGTLACAGVIGSLIPPSTNLIMYGVLAEQSVSELFMAGAIPGVILTVLFCLVVWLIAVLKPSAAPTIPKVPMGERLRALKYTLPILALFLLVIGGIYGGRRHRSRGRVCRGLVHASHDAEKICGRAQRLGQVYRHVLRRAHRRGHAQLLHDVEPHSHGHGFRHRLP